MPKIVHVDGVAFEQVNPASFYEAEIERYLLRHAPALFPDYHVLPFKLLVTSVSDDQQGAKPDLVFVAKDLSEWWLVEVEMSDHSLLDHVVPQIETMYNANYGSREAKYIVSKLEIINLESLTQLLNGKPPHLLVIINGVANGDWVTELRRYSCELSIFEIYRSSAQDELFALNGCYLPKFVEEILSECIFERSFGLLRVVQPQRIDVPLRGTVSLHYKDSISEWRRIHAQNLVWLEPASRLCIPFSERAMYQIVRHSDGSLGIIVVQAASA
jgi:hypothetical protein